jgi:ribosomal protein S18 acetylase RimI-like enzyme
MCAVRLHPIVRTPRTLSGSTGTAQVSLADDTLQLEIRRILEGDRAWSAYALADLCPPWNEQSRWLLGKDSVVLIYSGLRPPILFAHGEPHGLTALFAQLESGNYWYTLRPTDYALFGNRMQADTRSDMWRMRLVDFQPHHNEQVEALGTGHLVALEQLYGEHADQPDAFLERQLTHGIYYGIWEAGRLVSAAGTHVLCSETGVAAIGNVFTDPSRRGRGYATMATSAVVADLLSVGIESVVLNVEMQNNSAVKLYRRLGFMPYCGFYEGTARVSATHSEGANV